MWVDTTFVSQRLPAAGFVVCTHLTYEIDRSLGCARDDHAAAADPARWTSGIPEDELMWQHVLRHHRARGNQAVFAEFVAADHRSVGPTEAPNRTGVGLSCQGPVARGLRSLVNTAAGPTNASSSRETPSYTDTLFWILT